MGCKYKMKEVLIVIASFFIISSNYCFSQKNEMQYNRECHNENSMILTNVIEKALGKEEIIKLISKNKKNSFYRFEIGKYNDIFKLYIEFNSDGVMTEVSFIRNTDGKLNNRQRKKLLQYIKANNIKFNICWNDLSSIDQFSVQESERLGKLFFCRLKNKDVPYYGMNVHFPGFITQEFYDKYLRDLK